MVIATPTRSHRVYSPRMSDGIWPPWPPQALNPQHSGHTWETPCCSGDRPQLSQYSWARMCCPACTSALTMLACAPHKGGARYTARCAGPVQQQAVQHWTAIACVALGIGALPALLHGA